MRTADARFDPARAENAGNRRFQDTVALALACIAVVASGCGEKEEPELAELPTTSVAAPATATSTTTAPAEQGEGGEGGEGEAPPRATEERHGPAETGEADPRLTASERAAGAAVRRYVAPLDEQAHRLVVGERRHAVDRLAVDGERLAAGGEDVQVGAGLQERLGQCGDGSDQVLAVVQHQQQTTGAQVVGQRRRQRPARLLANAQDGGDRVRHQLGIGQRRQLDQPDAVRERVQHAQRDSASASRVFPTPGAPTSVTSRCAAQQRLTSAISRSRPTKLVSRAGRLCGASISAVLLIAPDPASSPR